MARNEAARLERTVELFELELSEPDDDKTEATGFADDGDDDAELEVRLEDENELMPEAGGLA